MGTVVISLDAELGWGFHDRDLPESVLRDARHTWVRLCRLFDTFEIPATWAIVGHLFETSCATAHRGHPAGERCCTKDAGDLPAQKVWFGDGLIETVANAAVDHEIASHGFTHVHFQHDSMDAEFAARELEHSVDAAAGRGFELTSFVFPVNRIGYPELLAEYGFDCYRGVNPANESAGAFKRKATKFSSAAFGTPTPPIVTPSIDEHGLVNIPASLYLFSFGDRYRSLFSTVGADPIVRQATAGIDRVAQTDGVFHMWLHPHNIRTPAHFERLRSIAAYLAKRRESGDITIETMATVADRTR
ncbi:polysaccharide deacetylase family protein (plasmid) [Haloferacaceae archaeon DSL9]